MKASWPRPTTRGLVVGVVGVILVVATWQLGDPALLWPGLFLCALPILSLIAAAVARPRLELRRTVSAAEVGVGEPVTVGVHVTQGRFPTAGALTVDDAPSPLLGPVHRTVVDLVGRRLERSDSYTRTPHARGHLPFGPMGFRYTDPLGLATVEVRALSTPGASEIVALPAALPLGTGAQAALATIAHHARVTATGEPDVIVRDYQPGDDQRRVDWKSSAHAGGLMVRRDADDLERRALVWLDTRPGLPHDTFEWLVTLASSACSALTQAGASVTLEAGTTWVRADDALPLRRALVDVAPTTDVTTPTPPPGIAVAIIGRLDRPTATLLTNAWPDALSAWVWACEADADAISALDRLDWRVAVTAPGGDAARAWSEFSATVPRARR